MFCSAVVVDANPGGGSEDTEKKKSGPQPPLPPLDNFPPFLQVCLWVFAAPPASVSKKERKKETRTHTYTQKVSFFNAVCNLISFLCLWYQELQLFDCFPFQDAFYQMNTKPKGYVMIVNNMSFDGSDLDDRTGSDRDAAGLKSVLTKLGFKVDDMRTDLSSQVTTQMPPKLDLFQRLKPNVYPCIQLMSVSDDIFRISTFSPL